MKLVMASMMALLAMTQVARAGDSDPNQGLRDMGFSRSSQRIVDVSIEKIRDGQRTLVQGAVVALPENGQAMPMQSWHEAAGKATAGYKIVLMPTADDEIAVDILVMDSSGMVNRRGQRVTLPAGATERITVANGFEVVLHRHLYGK